MPKLRGHVRKKTEKAATSPITRSQKERQDASIKQTEEVDSASAQKALRAAKLERWKKIARNRPVRNAEQAKEEKTTEEGNKVLLKGNEEGSKRLLGEREKRRENADEDKSRWNEIQSLYNMHQATVANAEDKLKSLSASRDPTGPISRSNGSRNVSPNPQNIQNFGHLLMHSQTPATSASSYLQGGSIDTRSSQSQIMNRVANGGQLNSHPALTSSSNHINSNHTNNALQTNHSNSSKFHDTQIQLLSAQTYKMQQQLINHIANVVGHNRTHNQNSNSQLLPTPASAPSAVAPSPYAYTHTQAGAITGQHMPRVLNTQFLPNKEMPRNNFGQSRDDRSKVMGHNQHNQHIQNNSQQQNLYGNENFMEAYGHHQKVMRERQALLHLQQQQRLLEEQQELKKVQNEEMKKKQQQKQQQKQIQQKHKQQMQQQIQPLVSDSPSSYLHRFPQKIKQHSFRVENAKILVSPLHDGSYVHLLSTIIPSYHLSIMKGLEMFSVPIGNNLEDIPPYLISNNDPNRAIGIRCRVCKQKQRDFSSTKSLDSLDAYSSCIFPQSLEVFAEGIQHIGDFHFPYCFSTSMEHRNEMSIARSEYCNNESKVKFDELKLVYFFTLIGHTLVPFKKSKICKPVTSTGEKEPDKEKEVIVLKDDENINDISDGDAELEMAVRKAFEKHTNSPLSATQPSTKKRITPNLTKEAFLLLAEGHPVLLEKLGDPLLVEMLSPNVKEIVKSVELFFLTLSNEGNLQKTPLVAGSRPYTEIGLGTVQCVHCHGSLIALPSSCIPSPGKHILSSLFEMSKHAEDIAFHHFVGCGKIPQQNLVEMSTLLPKEDSNEFNEIRTELRVFCQHICQGILKQKRFLSISKRSCDSVGGENSKLGSLGKKSDTALGIHDFEPPGPADTSIKSTYWTVAAKTYNSVTMSSQTQE